MGFYSLVPEQEIPGSFVRTLFSFLFFCGLFFLFFSETFFWLLKGNFIEETVGFQDRIACENDFFCTCLLSLLDQALPTDNF